MADNLVQVVGDRIGSELGQINAMNDQELLAFIAPWLDREVGEGLFAGTPIDRFRDWLQSVVLPHCRKLGESGQWVWDQIRDPDSAFAKDRIASIVLTLSVLSGLQQLDVSTLVAIAVLAIRNKSSKP